MICTQSPIDSFSVYQFQSISFKILPPGNNIDKYINEKLNKVNITFDMQS